MAKQIGPLLFVGTMKGVNYYFREGEALARRAGGGFSRKNIKESPNMETVRKSNSEFAHCSKVNKAFKAAIKPLLSGYKDGTLHSRLMQLFLKLKDGDLISERGNRSVHQGISVKAGKQLLTDFIFTPQRPQILSCPYEFDWNSLTFTVREFKVDQAAPFPKGADYMEIGVGLICFDFDTLAYEHIFADPLIIARDFQKDAFTIPCPELPGGEGMLFFAVRFSFYQTVNGERHLVPDKAHTGVRIISVLEGIGD